MAKVEYQVFRGWLYRGISHNPLMLHGTSVEAILTLTEGGRLLPGKGELDCSDYLEGRLYFSPVKSNLVGSNLYTILSDGATLRDALKSSSFHAKQNAVKHYLMDKFTESEPLSDVRWEWAEFLSSFPAEELSEIDLERFCRDFEIEKPVLEIRPMLEECVKRSGIIVEPDETILKLPHGKIDGGNDVWVECPEGLESEFIKGLLPLSDVDRKLLP